MKYDKTKDLKDEKQKNHKAVEKTIEAEALKVKALKEAIDLRLFARAPKAHASA